MRDPGWTHAHFRLGRATASRVHDIVARTKTGWATSRANYMAELIIERLIHNQVEHYHSRAMEDGIIREPIAREVYSQRSNLIVEDAGFVEHPTIALAGASPDGLVGDDGLVEFKCPFAATHLDLLLGGSVPIRYVHQMQWEMACTGRQWCDFVDFDARFPQRMQMLVRRVERDDIMIRELEEAVQQFLQELEAKLENLYRAYGESEVVA